MNERPISRRESFKTLAKILGSAAVVSVLPGCVSAGLELGIGSREIGGGSELDAPLHKLPDFSRIQPCFSSVRRGAVDRRLSNKPFDYVQMNYFIPRDKPEGKDAHFLAHFFMPPLGARGDFRVEIEVYRQNFNPDPTRGDRPVTLYVAEGRMGANAYEAQMFELGPVQAGRFVFPPNSDVWRNVLEAASQAAQMRDNPSLGLRSEADRPDTKAAEVKQAAVCSRA